MRYSGILLPDTAAFAAAVRTVRHGLGNGASSQAALSQDRDFWYDSTNKYCMFTARVGIRPRITRGLRRSFQRGDVLNINGVSWLEIQHLQIDWFDGYGVQVQGASDHIWLANMSANSEVENSTVPLGFYVHPIGTPVDIHLYNTDANMNYEGYRFDGCTGGGCSFEIKNCRAYANRAYGIVDNVQGAVSYDYCHLYANNLATALSVDTSGTPGRRREPTMSLQRLRPGYASGGDGRHIRR